MQLRYVLSAILASTVLVSCSPGTSGEAPKTHPTLSGTPGVLRPVGDQSIRKDGTVLRGVDIGCLRVYANNVVVTDSRVRCGANAAVRVMPGSTGFVLRDSEVDGLGKASVGVGYNNFTLHHVEVHDVTDGIRMGSETTVEDSTIHHLARHARTHNDGIQMLQGTNIVIRRNVVDVFRDGDFMNSAVIISPKNADNPVKNVLIEGNRFNGGNFTLYLGGSSVINVTVRGNTIGRQHRYGVVSAVPDGTLWQRNTYEDGTPVPTPSSARTS